MPSFAPILGHHRPCCISESVSGNRRPGCFVGPVSDSPGYVSSGALDTSVYLFVVNRHPPLGQRNQHHQHGNRQKLPLPQHSGLQEPCGFSPGVLRLHGQCACTTRGRPPGQVWHCSLDNGVYRNLLWHSPSLSWLVEVAHCFRHMPTRTPLLNSTRSATGSSQTTRLLTSASRWSCPILRLGSDSKPTSSSSRASGLTMPGLRIRSGRR